jgi:hypothetical protein
LYITRIDFYRQPLLKSTVNDLFRNIKVGNMPNILTETTAEFGVALLLTTSGRIPEVIRSAKE